MLSAWVIEATLELEVVVASCGTVRDYQRTYNRLHLSELVGVVCLHTVEQY